MLRWNDPLPLLAILMALAGCAAKPLPPTEAPSLSPSTVPEIVAPLHLATAVHTKNAGLVAAGLKPITSEEIGYYMDVQDGRLRQLLGPAGFGVERDGDAIKLTLSGVLTFEANSTQLRPDALAVLATVAEVLAEYDRTLIVLVGHTDNQGESDYNQALSEQRALALASQLDNQGVSVERMLVIGRGESAPIDSNDTEQGRLKNRRVEIRIEPIDD